MRLLTRSTILLTSVSPVCSLDSVEQSPAFLLTAAGHCDSDPALLRGSLQTAEQRPQSQMTSLIVYNQQVCQRDKRRNKYKTECLLPRDGYCFFFFRYQCSNDTFKTIPVPKRCLNRYFFFFFKAKNDDS